MQEEIFQLSQLILTHANTLVETCKSQKFEVPSSHSLHNSQQFRQDSSANLSADIITTAALQLITIITPGNELILSLLNGHYYTAALRVCIKLNIAEIIREGGSQGMHFTEIANRCAIDEGKLGSIDQRPYSLVLLTIASFTERILRLLSLRHVFREGPPGVFSNNRLSEALDTGKAVHELNTKPESKHRNTSGEVAMFEIRYGSLHIYIRFKFQWQLTRSEGPKLSSSLFETLTDSRIKLSDKPNETAFQHVMGTQMPFWEYIDQPRNELIRYRFNIAMRGWAMNNDPESSILRCLDWHTLGQDAKVVDIGGGIGSAMIPLANNFPNLQIIIEDVPAVIKDGTTFWNAQRSQKVIAKLVYDCNFLTRTECNIFGEQPVKDAAVFHIRRVLHNWSDRYAKRILLALHQAATPKTKLVVAELLLHPTCVDPINDNGTEISGYQYKCAPKPLLANYGSTHEVSYMTDLTMLTLFNGQDRTLAAMQRLLEDSGWYITHIYGENERHLAHIVAERGPPKTSVKL
ncbi:hypothetical protein D9757_011395 [Collybiopsis confluens]|uniref:O-methyltransferase n=1 Tax=Collybiopsis confluens TaxID=2823264 RepID=A0A8H5LR50_9AGAR|nr:hypothetical protein D9757_011395 [Collybiopsis confluens]